MNKKTIITTFPTFRRLPVAFLLALVAMIGHAQKHLPAFQYSKEPAVLSGMIIGDASQRPNSVGVRYLITGGQTPCEV